MITVIVPHARPEHSTNLLANFRRQAVECRLVVVENGDALCATAWPHDVVRLLSEPHQADARNAGLTWLRAQGGGAWAMMDDDDYYSPGYLGDVEATLLRTRADVVGKRWSFVMYDDGLYRFSVDRGCEWAESYNLTGGSLAAHSADVADFPRRRDDDLGWCEAMRERGARLWAGSPWHYGYDRRGSGERVIRGSQVITRRAFGDADYYGPLPIEAVGDTTIRPLRHVPMPSDAEIFEALGQPQ